MPFVTSALKVTDKKDFILADVGMICAQFKPAGGLAWKQEVVKHMEQRSGVQRNFYSIEFQDLSYCRDDIILSFRAEGGILVKDP